MDAQKIENVTTHCAGFLTYDHPAGEASVDAIVSMVALHHLPDFWKAVAIERLTRWLRPGGKFYLMDVVFPFVIADYRQGIEQWLGTIRNHGEVSQEAVTHIRNEYSTFDWVLEGIFERCGLAIESKNQWSPGAGLDYVVVKR
ncbi:MAG: methyltransferase domain-containing protein [Thermoguttaceae bacterium]|nr:methyltransferase domain-containing protein [Thermoguttaceae bacterium]